MRVWVEVEVEVGPNGVCKTKVAHFLQHQSGSATNLVIHSKPGIDSLSLSLFSPHSLTHTLSLAGSHFLVRALSLARSLPTIKA
jgi:hypothetical protein